MPAMEVGGGTHRLAVVRRASSASWKGICQTEADGLDFAAFEGAVEPQHL